MVAVDDDVLHFLVQTKAFRVHAPMRIGGRARIGAEDAFIRRNKELAEIAWVAYQLNQMGIGSHQGQKVTGDLLP